MSCCKSNNNNVTKQEGSCEKKNASCCKTEASNTCGDMKKGGDCCKVESKASCNSDKTSCCAEEDMKTMVRKDYGEIAQTIARNADEVAKKFGYSKEELENIPEGANLGVSCGNPLAHATLKEGEVVVDLGSGAGLDCFIASSKVGASGKVYGIDMTPEMLAAARANAAKRNITNVEFLQGEIEAIPLPDGVADLVISNCVINLVPNKTKAFSEIHRILKPGGRLAISDIVLKKELPAALKENLQMYSACFSGAMMLNSVSDFLLTAGFQGILVSDSNVDLNAYKELEGTGSGCCGSIAAPSPSPSPSSSSCCSDPSSCSPCATTPSPSSNDKSKHPLMDSLSKVDFDFNEYAASAKIFACK